MIGKLKGVVDAVGEDFVIVDVHGVGYVVHCSARTLGKVGAAGEAVVLSIETFVREDMIRLYGFRTDGEREWFRLLQTVQGVGSKVALGILSVLDPEGLAGAIATGDKVSIGRGPGVGPKLAARIVAELKDKAPGMGNLDPGMIQLAGALDARTAPLPVSDAVSALVNLGYPHSQASAAVAVALKSAGEAAEAKTLIRLGLRELAR